jgi:hypothetical protein
MKLHLAFIAFSLFIPLSASSHEEVLVIEQLIETTQKNLINQKALLEKLRAYHQARDAFIGDPDSSKLATWLVKRAMHLHLHLEQAHLSHLFSTDFLTELSFYNQVGKHQLAGR